jgi:MYXO-CTERM domain-containing protein
VPGGGGSAPGIDLPGGLNLGGSSNGSGTSTKGGRTAKAPGCACEVVGGTPGGNAALLLAGLAAMLGALRRRRAA